VFFEWDQQVVYGDWKTKMTLSYETIGSQVLRMKSADHLINTTTPCVQCPQYTALPTSAPSGQPIRPPPKPKPKHHSPSKSPTPSSKSSKSVFARDVEEDESLDHDNSYGEDIFEGYQGEEEEGEESPHSHLRNLHHKKAVRTHSPTMSPAPTMVQPTAFDTWEQIVLTGNDGTSGWDRTYNVEGYVAANIPMKYFISDKDGKHLYSEGTKCNADLSLTCWNDLPPGDRDYILRVGGAASSTADTLVESWSLCGITREKMVQLDFRVKDFISGSLNSEECDALLTMDRTEYCANRLKLVVGASGIIVLEGLSLDSFSQVDLDLLGHAVSLLFSPTSMLEVSFDKHMHSSRGAHVGFTVEVPSSVFGLDATAFETLNTTSVNTIQLLKSADFSKSVDDLLLELSALGLESNLNNHGRIYVEDIVTRDMAKAQIVRDPFYYVEDDDVDVSETSFDGTTTTDGSSLLMQTLTLIQVHSLSFLVLMIGVVVLYVRRRAQSDDDDNDLSFLRAGERKKKKSSLVKVPRSEKHNSSRSSGKRHKREGKDGRKHKHRPDSSKSDTVSSTLQARASALKSYEAKMSDSTPALSTSSDTRSSPRFVPYGSAAELASEEGWATGSGGGGGGGGEEEERGRGVRGEVQEEQEEEDEFGDELDNILSHFDSSSSSDGSGSGSDCDDGDEWEHA
jgi:hypothetical protein